MKKLLYWLVDYAHMIKGASMMYYHRNPPKHYLGQIVEGKVPVLLVPGIFGKWGFMKKIGDKISLAGHPVYVITNTGHNLRDIPSSSEYVTELIKEQKLDSLIIVGYSKGGLIGAYTLAKSEARNKIKALITIATPFSGSDMAKMLPGRIFRDLDPRNLLLKELYQNKEIKNKIVSIIPFYDTHVWSEKKSYLDGARENIEVQVAGHSKVVFDNGVNKIVLEWIQKISDE